MMMRKLQLLLAISFISSFGFGQMSIFDADYDQANPLNCGALAAGGTNFVDIPNSNYQSNTDETIVFCPDLTQGSKVSIAFATNIGYEFNIDPTDTMYIYDGLTTAAPLLGMFNSGTDPNGFSVQASFENNSSGCLTVRFRSDAATEGTGWVAKVACGNLVQPFYPHLEAFINNHTTNDLNPIDTGYVNVCLGDSVLLVAKPSLPYAEEVTGTGYSQTLENIVYHWNIGGVGVLASTNDSVWFTPPARQGYFIDCRMQDIFPHQERITCKIRVSQQPIFAGTGPMQDSVCLGVSTELLGGVTPTDTVGVEVPNGNFPVGGNFAGLTFLPDGSGVSYQTTINMTGLGPGTITSANDIASICLDIEHSYIGDLEIGLKCPNGTLISLANTYGGNGLFAGGCFGGGVFLGNDTDQDGGAPGTPVETYCFSVANATFGTMCAGLGNTVTNAYGFQMLNPNGVYAPDGNWNSFIGCPLEGPWTIVVQDNQGIDDGYIFQWSILFDQSLYPNPETYQNVIVSDNWSADPTIVSGQNDTSIVVLPIVAGPHNYTYNVTDDFGCHYDTTVVLFAIDNPIIFPDTFACDLSFVSQGNFAFGGGVWSCADTNVHILPNVTTLDPTFVSSIPGTFAVTFTDNTCNSSISSNITFLPYPVLIPDSVFCGEQFQMVGTISAPGGGTWTSVPNTLTFNTPTSLNPLITAPQTGTYTVTYTDNACNNSASTNLTFHFHPVIFPDTSACDYFYQVQNTYSSTGGTWSSADTNIHFVPNNTTLNPIIQSSTGAGTYDVTFTDNACNEALTSTIHFLEYPWTDVNDTNNCIGVTTALACVLNVNNQTYLWNTGSTTNIAYADGPGVYYVTVANTCGTFTDSATVIAHVCDINAPNIIVLSSTQGNNAWFINYDGIKEYHVSIVNRWQNVIYESNDPAVSWKGESLNGDLVSEGTYFYIITATMISGEEMQKQGFIQVYH